VCQPFERPVQRAPNVTVDNHNGKERENKRIQQKAHLSVETTSEVNTGLKRYKYKVYSYPKVSNTNPALNRMLLNRKIYGRRRGRNQGPYTEQNADAIKVPLCCIAANSTPNDSVAIKKRKLVKKYMQRPHSVRYSGQVRKAQRIKGEGHEVPRRTE
jgi:hypothetical protein